MSDATLKARDEASSEAPASVVYSLKGKRVWVAGHRGMVGSALVRRLEREAIGDLLIATRQEVDLRDPSSVRDWCAKSKPEAVFVPAAKVGGILANDTYPAEFLHDNLMIAANVIHAAHLVDVEKLVFLGSSCIYPKFADQPIMEDSLLTGPLEPTNEWYAIAKIAGVKLCQAYRKQYGRDFISAMPTNLFGPGDNFDLANSHVIPAIIRKVDAAKREGVGQVEVWGTGSPRREFLHVDDCADAIVFLMQRYSGAEHVNVGSGEDLTILELTRAIMQTVGYDGEIVHDLSKPDGTPRKLMSADRLRSMGWSPSISLEDGLADAYRWYSENVTAQ